MDIDTINKQIDVLLEGQRFGDLSELCRTILSLGDTEIGPEVNYRLALIGSYALFQQQQYQDSFDLLNPLYESGYGEIDVLFLLTAVCLAQERYNEAVSFGDELILKFSTSGYESKAQGITNARNNAHEICNNLGSACIKIGKNEKAIDFFKSGIEFRKDFPMLYENLIAVYSFDSRWAEAHTVIEEGLTQCPESKELNRVSGVVLQNLHKYGFAENAYKKSFEAGLNEAALDLGVLYQSMSRFREAVHWLDKAVALDPSNLKAGNLRDNIKDSRFYSMKEPTISAALIVKNEEELLGQCLDSIRDAVDEIVVVDTGSDDNTVEIAARYDAKIYHHPWNDDFSEARNISIAKTTGDWVLIIDADEVLLQEDILKVRELKWNDEYDCFCFAIFSQLPGNLGGINRGKHFSPRIFKRREDIYYEGIVHNVLRMPKLTAMSDIRFFHYGYDLRMEKMEEKFKRSLTLLLRQVKDNPDDPFIRYNLAQMYLSRDYYKEAKDHAEQIVHILTPDDENQLHIYLMGLYQLAMIHKRANEYEKAEEFCKRAIAIKPNYIDPMLALGWIYFDTKRYKEAEEILKDFIKYCNEIESGDDYNLIIFNKLGSDFETYYLLGEMYRNQGKLDDAAKMLNKSVELNSYFWKSFKSLGEIALTGDDGESAELFFEQAIKLGYLNAEKYGTTLGPRKDYEDLLEKYKQALYSKIDKKHEEKSVESALSKIDELLGNR